MNMPLIALGFGILLNFLGLGSFVTTGMVSATALIPCVPGVLIGICGLIGTEGIPPQARHARGRDLRVARDYWRRSGASCHSSIKGEFELTPATGSMIMMAGHLRRLCRALREVVH
jgi:hypothetical protein